MKKSSEEKEITKNENNKTSLSESQKQWASLFSQINAYRPNETFQQRYLRTYPFNLNGASEAYLGNAIMMNNTNNDEQMIWNTLGEAASAAQQAP